MTDEMAKAEYQRQISLPYAYNWILAARETPESEAHEILVNRAIKGFMIASHAGRIGSVMDGQLI